MLVQAGLCQTCSETTLLVFPRGGSNFSGVSFLKGALIALDIESPRYAYFYDVDAKAQIEKITSSEEAYFGVCMYHKDNQPSKAACKYCKPIYSCKRFIFRDFWKERSMLKACLLNFI